MRNYIFEGLVTCLSKKRFRAAIALVVLCMPASTVVGASPDVAVIYGQEKEDSPVVTVRGKWATQPSPLSAVVDGYRSTGACGSARPRASGHSYLKVDYGGTFSESSLVSVVLRQEHFGDNFLQVSSDGVGWETLAEPNYRVDFYDVTVTMTGIARDFRYVRLKISGSDIYDADVCIYEIDVAPCPDGSFKVLGDVTVIEQTVPRGFDVSAEGQSNVDGFFGFEATNGASSSAVMIAVVGLTDGSQWAGGEPQVIYHGVPSQNGTAGEVWFDSLTIPDSAGFYELWCKAYMMTNETQAINDFKANPPQTEACKTRRVVYVEVAEGMPDTPETLCAITTAASGSQMMKHLDALRRFRDKYLLTSTAGRSFVEWYYQVSPSVSGVLRDSAPLRFVAREILKPIIAVAYLALYWPLTVLVLLLVFWKLTTQKMRRSYVGSSGGTGDQRFSTSAILKHNKNVGTSA